MSEFIKQFFVGTGSVVCVFPDDTEIEEFDPCFYRTTTPNVNPLSSDWERIAQDIQTTYWRVVNEKEEQAVR